MEYLFIFPILPILFGQYGAQVCAFESQHECDLQ